MITDLFLWTDLQNVNITLRILFRPVPSSLPNIYSTLGIDYDERVLPSITNEILKAVVVCYHKDSYLIFLHHDNFILSIFTGTV